MPDSTELDQSILSANDKLGFLQNDNPPKHQSVENEKDIASELEDNIRQTIKPFIEEIRLRMPVDEEIGGYILDGQLVVKKGEQSSFTHGDWNEVRSLAEKGAIAFHTHPGRLGANVESPADIVASYANFGEAIFTENKIIILVPEKIMSTEEIKELASNLISQSDAYDQDYYASEYWCWSDLVRTNFPVRKSILLEKESVKE